MDDIKGPINIKSLLGNIKRMRIIRQYSQDYVAVKLGVSQNVISKLETGKIPLTITRLIEISKLYGISPIQLMEGQLPSRKPAATSTKDVEPGPRLQ
jgi:transcriptional regulator with XRE-family HTH domain